MKLGKLFFLIFVLLIASDLTLAQQTVKACGHHDYPPWNWKKDDKIIGACAEITETLFGKAGLSVDLSYKGPWSRCQYEIEQGEVDINICSFINEDRKKYSQFIETPMGFNENAIFVKKGYEFPFHNWKDLKKRRAGMVLGVSIGQEFDSFVAENIEVLRLRTYEQVFRLLLLDRVDFAPFGRYSGITMIRTFGMDGQIVDLPNPVVTGKLYISMSKKSEYLNVLPVVEELIKEKVYYHWVDELLNKYASVYAEDYIKSLTDGSEVQ